MRIDENILDGDHRHAVLWQQEPVDGVAEPALSVRTYCDRLVGIRQDGSEILINAGSMSELCKLLKRYAAHQPKERK